MSTRLRRQFTMGIAPATTIMGIARGTVTIMGIVPGAVTIAVGSNDELQCQCMTFLEQPYRHLRAVAGRQLLHVKAMGQIHMEHEITLSGFQPVATTNKTSKPKPRITKGTK
jgi:hypothetical protein